MSGKHVAKTKRRARNRKFPLALMALVLVAVMAVGGTAAYLITNTVQVKNQFTPANVDATVSESFVDGVKSAVKIQNSGNTPAYIRVAIVANAVDADGHVVAGTAPSYAVDSNKWDKIGNYYYYKGVVPAGEYTDELFTGNVTLNGQELNILAQAVQAEGGFNGEDPEVYAWGVDYNNGNWSPVITN